MVFLKILSILSLFHNIVGLIRDMIGKSRANCDKSMKLAENTQYDVRNRVEYIPLLKNAPMCYF